MSDVRTFRAATMREALDRVRSELGREAVILATRQVPVKRLLPWGNREEVEITAGLGIATRPLPSHSIPATTMAPSRPGRTPGFIETRRPDGNEVTFERSTPQADAETASPLPRMRPSFRSHSSTNHVTGSVSELGDAKELTNRLDAIERMLAELNRRQRVSDDVSADVRPVYDRLIASDVDEVIARELATSIKDELTPAQLADPAAVRMKLTRLVEAELKCSGPIAVEHGRRKVVALAGPTGVGKTTTLAKLAANFRLREGLRVGLVTLDTYRIAAVDQLRTYAEIIDLPIRVVNGSAEMRTALDELAGLDLVLIDTAGRSPRDGAQIAELNELLAAARPDETHLVLSLTADRSGLAQAVERFRPIGPTAIVATKLDEVDGPGSLLSLCRDSGLPISYLTLGQEVPDDIEPARPDRLAKWIVSESRVQRPESRDRDLSL